MIRRAPAIALLLMLGWHPARAAERVVSLNLCADQYLVLLAPEKAVALTRLARDPSISFVADRARAFPSVRPAAEAVLALHPDLVLAGYWGAQTTLAALERQGVRVMRLGAPTSFDGIRTQTRTLGEVLGEPARAAALVAGMDAELAALPPRPPEPARALIWEAGGYAARPGTLDDTVLRAAGLRNASDGGRVGLEALLRHPPGLLVVPEPAAYPSLATDLLSHPAIAAIPRRVLPSALTICAGPFTAEAPALLAR